MGHVTHNAQISQMPAKEQPESKSDSPTADDVNVDTQGAKKSVRFSSLHAVARSGQPTNPLDPSVARSEQSRATRDFWISSGNQSLIRVHLEPRSELFVPHQSECPVPSSRLCSSRQTKMQPCKSSMFDADAPLMIDDDWKTTSSSSMNFQWVGTTTFRFNSQHQQHKTLSSTNENSTTSTITTAITSANAQIPQQLTTYPTESALQQKKKKAEGHVAKPRQQAVEQQYDDCGENFDALQCEPLSKGEQAEQELFVGEQSLFEHVCFAISKPCQQFLGSGASTDDSKPINAHRFGSMTDAFHAPAQYDALGIDFMELLSRCRNHNTSAC